MLPKEAIEEYKALHQKRFGVLLSDDDASEQATKLVHLYQILFDATTKDNLCDRER